MSDKSKSDKTKTSRKSKSVPAWLRQTFKALRYLLVPILCLAAVIIGVFIGYVILGGRDFADILNLSAVKHLIDLVFAE